MDELARYNKERWEDLAKANIRYSRPLLDLDEVSARQKVDPKAWVSDVKGKDVLCLASGGGQQSAAWAILGAHVTVLDISETQLERDRFAARHYGVNIETVNGDMRDLSVFDKDSFDIVYHVYSINFVPSVMPVFNSVSRVLRSGGMYYLQFHNPFTIGVDETDWNGEAYPLRHHYIDGEEMFVDDPYWDVDGGDGVKKKIVGPREFRHTLSTVFNGLAEHGFVMLTMWEEASGDPNAEGGTWEHFKSVAPPYIHCWFAYRPDVLGQQT